MYVGHFLERNGTIFRNKVALKWKDRSTTFSQLKERCLRLGSALLSLGLAPGDRVAFLDYNSCEYVEFHLAIPLAGLVAVPLNFRLSGNELKAIVNYSSCKALFYRSSFIPVVEEIRKDLTSASHFICLDGPRERDMGYDELLARGRTENPPPPHDDDPACILFTSGTTGTPKGATLTHGNHISALRGLIIEVEIVPENIFLHVAPLFHIAPLQNLLAYLYRGCTCVMVTQFDPRLIIETIQTEGITNTFFVPRMISAILSHPDLGGYNLSSLSSVAYGGAPTPPEVLRNFLERWGPIFVQHYGASEAGLITLLRPKEHAIKDGYGRPRYLGSSGRPIIDVRVKIVDDSGQETGPREVGEILVSSLSVMKGYWNMPDETGECIKEGWFHTGDLGSVDTDGYLFHTDRKKYMIISGGENIYPAEVENVLHMMPEILEAAVIGVPDEKWGETVKAVLVLREGCSLTDTDVMEFCKNNLASYKKPTSVDFIQELPRNPSGKILKNVLKERYLNKVEKSS
jgi:long-chain acyl-CoA synthetase